MTKVEEVARAIYAARSGEQREVEREFIMENYAPLARAAIEAMRMMTPAMDREGYDAGIRNACDTSCAAMTDYRVTKIWTAMIDAALSEP
jgi:hypothetical protein